MAVTRGARYAFATRLRIPNVAVVGNEGMLGISLFMGGETTPSRALVQSAGHAFRLKAGLLKNEFGRYGPTMHLLLRYTQAMITQMAQTAVCIRHHSVDASWPIPPHVQAVSMCGTAQTYLTMEARLRAFTIFPAIQFGNSIRQFN